MDLRNKTTSKFRTDFRSPLGVPNSQVSLHVWDQLEMWVLHTDGGQQTPNAGHLTKSIPVTMTPSSKTLQKWHNYLKTVNFQNTVKRLKTYWIGINPFNEFYEN